MRTFVALTVGALVLLPLAARAQGGMEKDPTKKVAGGGVLVAGWQARTDKAADKVENLKFESMGPGFHITGGPHAIYWNPANVAKGNYTAHATFAKRGADSQGHVESYGLFIGGSHLNEDNQNYLYCVVFGNGTYSVIHRYGGETHQLASRQANDAVSKSDATGNAKDAIAWTVSGDKVACSINDKEVFSAPKADMIGTAKLESTDGVYGLRASHNLSIHVSDFGVRQGGK